MEIFVKYCSSPTLQYTYASMHTHMHAHAHMFLFITHLQMSVIDKSFVRYSYLHLIAIHFIYVKSGPAR